MSALVLSWLLASCGGVQVSPTAPVVATQVNSYWAINNEGLAGDSPGKQSAYTISHSNDTFVQLSEADGRSQSEVDYGAFSTSGNGFLDISLGVYSGTLLSSADAERGNWALEVPGAMGLLYASNPNAAGLSGTSGPQGQGDTSNALVPLVENSTCPSIPPTTFQYITYPGPFINPAFAKVYSWNPATDPAYGSVDITTEGPTTVNLTNITQYLLPTPSTNSAPPVAPGTPVLPAGTANASGACGTTAFGSLTTIPANNTTTTTGEPPVASFGISPAFLLEDSGSLAGSISASTILGGGYGAIGLPKPSASVDTGAIVATNYVGFISEAEQAGSAGYGYFTTTAGFGTSLTGKSACAALQASLATLANPPSANTIYGGEFSDNDPSLHSASNCDFAIDLGTEDSKNNGLYPNAKIFVGSTYPANVALASLPQNNGVAASPYSFPAVIIAGEINGRNAIFAVAADEYQFPITPLSVGIYLLQATS